MLKRIYFLLYPRIFLLFWYLAVMRSHIIYQIDRGITARTMRTRWVPLLESPVYVRIQAWSVRWGVLAVPVPFLTVGIQNVIQLSTGVARIPLRRHVAATAVGAIAWAIVYTTIGMAIPMVWFTGPTGCLICLPMLIALVPIAVTCRSRAMRAGRDSGCRERV